MRVLGLMSLAALGVACVTGAPTPPPETPAPPAAAQASATPADTDGDGVTDRADKCPGDAETRNGYQDDDGCPDLSLRPATSTDDPTRIVERVEFEYDSAAIKPTSFALLDAIAVVVKMQPQQFPIVALEGHAADNEHSPMKLSLARASAVRLALLARGVDESRLLARASGTSAPGCTEQSEVCRAHERTVEFVKVAGTKAATGETESPRPDADRAPDQPPPVEKSATVAVPLERVEFKKGSALLGPASQANLDVLAGFMKGTPAPIEIVGYADDNERKPDALAQARADAVRRYMLACGVSAQYLTTRTERTGRAACRSHSASCSARDGRAELRFIEPEAPPARAADEQAPSRPAPSKADGE
jgi:outer membrane protein OmpA-like peptidoglycan-associated protein